MSNYQRDNYSNTGNLYMQESSSYAGTYPYYSEQGMQNAYTQGNSSMQQGYYGQSSESFYTNDSSIYTQEQGYRQSEYPQETTQGYPPQYGQEYGQTEFSNTYATNSVSEQSIDQNLQNSQFQTDLPPMYFDKTNLQYASEYDYLNADEMNFSFRKMKDWNKSTNVGFVLDGILFSYLGAVGIYFAIYFWMNGGPVPRNGWNDMTAFIICLVFILLATLVYSFFKIRNKVETFTVGTVYQKEITDRTQEQIWKKGTPLLWVFLYGSQMTIPVQVKKDVWKNYSENERVILYSRRHQPFVRVLHLFSYKQRQKQKMMGNIA